LFHVHNGAGRLSKFAGHNILTFQKSIMQIEQSPNAKAPLLCWDLFCLGYNSILEGATQYQQSVTTIKQIAKTNKWTGQQMLEAIDNIPRYVILITDHLQRISFTGRGFYEMTGYTFSDAKGRNPNFLQGPGTNRKNTGIIKELLGSKEPTEMIIENYRRNGEMYLCKIIIKPVVNANNKLVNYIAYEQEIAA
jgi:PAS domain S-box-containing protein